MLDLESRCIPRDLNSSGSVVGFLFPGPNSHACIIDGTGTIDLGTFGGRASNARALNNRGDVVVQVSASTGHQAWLWDTGTGINLAPIVVATDINSRGQVVGRSAEFRGLLLDRGGLTDLGDLGHGGTFPFAINERGQVVGYAASGPNSHHAFLWNRGMMSDLGTLNAGWSSEAVAVNNRGEVLVQDINFAQGIVQAWLYSSGAVTPLGSLGPGRTYPGDINNRGQVVGDLNQNRAWFWENGEMIDLGHYPGATASVAVAIDDAGRVIGSSGGRAVVWLP
jgi:probable HAF family extracellular repeat protein